MGPSRSLPRPLVKCRIWGSRRVDSPSSTRSERMSALGRKQTCAVQLGMSAMGHKRTSGVRVPAPSLLGHPPNNPATTDCQKGKSEPYVDARGDWAEGQSESRQYHRQVVRPGITAMGSSATFRIQNARSPHPKKSNGPDRCSQRYSGKQSGNDCTLRQPPSDKLGASVTQPIG